MAIFGSQSVSRSMSRPQNSGRGEAYRLSHRCFGVVLAAAVTFSGPLAVAQPVNPSDAEINAAQAQVNDSAAQLAQFAAGLTAAQEQLTQWENEMGRLREAINKALVDLHEAQASAELARQNSRNAKEELDKTQEELAAEQATLDEISRSAYRRGTTSSAVTGLAGAKNAEDALARQTYLRTAAQKQNAVVDNLDRLRTENANEESRLRASRKLAEDREAEATAAESAARAAIEDNAAKIAAAQAEHERLAAARDAAEQQLAAAQAESGRLISQRAEFEEHARQQIAEQTAQDAQAAVRPQDAPVIADPAAVAAVQAVANAPEAAAATAAQEAAQEAVETADPQVAQQKAQQAADEAVRARHVAEKAEETAGDDADAKQLAADLGRAAAAAASLAAAALIAVNEPKHGTVDNPYPREEGDAASVISAVRDAASLVDRTFGTGDGLNSVTTTATPTDESASVTPTEDPYDLPPIVTVQSGVTATQTVTRTTSTQATTTTRPTSTRNGTADDPISGALNTLTEYLTLKDLSEVTDTATEVITGTREEKIEGVIARAKGMLGTPYAWGGGNAVGPTRGIRDGGVADSYGDYNKIGFDCSGLVLYAFAGAGIALPHYTGYQYQRGTKIPTSEIERGDLLFWGPNAEYHVAIYLGDGMMIEAPQSGSTVRVSSVRWSGMSPYAVRLI